MNIALILAGGMGTRFGSDRPKQFVMCEKMGVTKTVIEHTVDAFESNQQIDEINIVLHKDYIAHFKEIEKRNEYKKINLIIPAGKDRFYSAFNGVMAKKYANDDVILIHDGARPFVSDRIISESMLLSQEHKAVSVCVKMVDSIVSVCEQNDGFYVEKTLDRKKFMRVQTPQTFRFKTIYEAYEKATKNNNLDNAIFTDDCSVVAKMLPEIQIAIVEGEEANKKITFPTDL